MHSQGVEVSRVSFCISAQACASELQWFVACNISTVDEVRLKDQLIP